MRVINDIAHATAFLSRLPVPPAAFGESRLDFARQAWAFPLVALPLAAVAGAIGWAATALFDNATVAVLLVLVSLLAMTGALHEDGLADCADGFWGAREPARRLAIMRDSAVGTYGVLALVAVFAMRIAAAASLLVHFGPLAFAALLLAGIAFGRTALIFPWALHPPAIRLDEGTKGESLATRFGRPDGRQALLAGAVCVVLLLPALLATGFATLAAAVALGGALELFVTRLSQAKIGGHTGDTLGATALLAETGFLLGALATTSGA